MQEHSFTELMGGYIKDEELLDAFAGGKITDIKIFEELYTMEIHVTLPGEVNSGTLAAACACIQASTGLEKVTITPSSVKQNNVDTMFPDLPISARNSKVIYGSAFKRKPVPIGEVSYMDGGVVVWGEVFKFTEQKPETTG